MTSATRKLLAWVAMAATTGGTALFILIAIEKGLPQGREWWINLWPVTTGIGMVLSFFALRRLYRDESGFWHLSIGDLLCVTVTFGALLGITQSACDDLNVAQRIIVSALIAAVTLVGLLVASRLGIPQKRRFVFGVAFALGTTGLLIVGGLLTLTTVACVGERSFDVIAELPRAWNRSATFRTALTSLPICLPAVGFCYWMSKTARHERTTL
jgi:hypothetical protein